MRFRIGIEKKQAQHYIVDELRGGFETAPDILDDIFFISSK